MKETKIKKNSKKKKNIDDRIVGRRSVNSGGEICVEYTWDTGGRNWID